MKGSGMPQIRSALKGWMRPITMTRRIDVVTDGLVSTSDYPFTFRGTIQPLSPRAIALKPDGQRAWQWLQLHCLATDASKISVNDKVMWNGKLFKVMGQNDYSLHGYMEYHLVEDYQDGQT